ncbi:hypothetical protein PC123_g4456 [Phytophthora cactorum]|nr:hypothetical protein PC123_g4456 [Phytophthora cactorum]
MLLHAPLSAVFSSAGCYSVADLNEAVPLASRLPSVSCVANSHRIHHYSTQVAPLSSAVPSQSSLRLSVHSSPVPEYSFHTSCGFVKSTTAPVSPSTAVAPPTPVDCNSVGNRATTCSDGRGKGGGGTAGRGVTRMES